MPRGRDHQRMTKKLLGWDIAEVHGTMDAAVRMLGGKHRVIGHDARSIRAMEQLFGARGRIVAFCHVMQDMGVLTGTGGTLKVRVSRPVRLKS